MSGRVLAFGEALWDLLPDGAVLGGAPLNFAYRLNTLGTPTLPVSQLGMDELGRKARARIRSLGVNDDFIFETDDYPTGTVSVAFTEEGEPRYTIERDVAYDHIPAADPLLKEAAVARAVCYGTLAQRSPVSRSSLAVLLDAAPNALRIYDINLRTGNFYEEIIRTSLSGAQICKLNEEEMAELNGMFSLGAKELQEAAALLAVRFNLETVIVTLGKKGAFVVPAHGEPSAEAGYVAPAGGDPLGAGDAFTAGFIHSVLQEREFSEAVRFGNALGALVAGQKGATVEVGPDQVEAFMRSGDRREIEKDDYRIN